MKRNNSASPGHRPRGRDIPAGNGISGDYHVNGHAANLEP